MREGCIEWEGKLLTFQYQVREYYDFASATVWDKHGNSFVFFSDRGWKFHLPNVGWQMAERAYSTGCGGSKDCKARTAARAQRVYVGEGIDAKKPRT